MSEIIPIFQETLFYAFFAGLAFAVLYLLIAVGLLPTAFLQGRKKYLSRLSRLALFLGLLFAWGAVASGVWWYELAPRWYVRADPFIEYVPILPLRRLGDRRDLRRLPAAGRDHAGPAAALAAGERGGLGARLVFLPLDPEPARVALGGDRSGGGVIAARPLRRAGARRPA